MVGKSNKIGEVVRVPIDSILENPMNYEIYSSKHDKEDADLESSIQARKFNSFYPFSFKRKSFKFIFTSRGD